MSVEFTRIPLITAGAKPVHGQIVNLAAGVNPRMTSGVGNIPWRLVYYLEALWRQVRNPDASGFAFAPQLEATNGLLAVDPDKSTQTWPVADPGDYEGANLSNPMMAHVYGVGDVPSESDSLGPPNFTLDETAATPLEFWELGKAQRGAYDPATGAQSWPAGEAAQRFFRIAQAEWSPHGKAWGGFLPSPVELLPDCGTTDDTGAGIPSQEIFFTSLADAEPAPDGHHGTESTVSGKTVVTYDGSCPCGTDSAAAGHVQWVWEGPMAYYVWVLTNASTCESAIDRYPLSDWIQGPYTGVGKLRHTDGGQLKRVVHGLASDYRGTPAQRTPDTFRIQSIAFDMDRFLSQQYALAPARGEQDGEYVDALYPTGTWTGATTIASGTVGQIGGSDTYAVASGFVVAGFCAHGTGLTGPASVEVLDGTSFLALLTLVPDETGAASAISWRRTATRPAALKFRLATAATFSSTAGIITCEAAELVEQLPEYFDAAMICRIGSAHIEEQVYGRGLDCDTSKEIGDSYFRYGCAAGTMPPADEVEVNRNASFDVARRMTNRVLRTLDRNQFVAYEVADGKSILYLKRFSALIPSAVTDRVDLLDGIAPPYDPVASGHLVEGETYLVHGTTGSVTYDGDTVALDGTFTATAVLTFTATGDAAVYVKDGIRAHALKRGWSNRWCGFAEVKRYRNSEDSIYKPSAYTDYWPFCDRCHFGSGMVQPALARMMSLSNYVEYDGSAWPHVLINPRLSAAMLAPEAPDAHRYSLGANTATNEANHPEEFRKSCRVYEPVPEIESATVHDWSGNQVIKLVFAHRFHSHPDAPATWSSTAPTWTDGGTVPTEVTNLVAEDYRTLDNGLRSYHVHIANSFWNADVKTGDHGMNTTITGEGAPHGSCYPQFFLVALVNTPYEDDNEVSEPHDTRMTVDELQKAELYLRAGCEGFVDDRTSKEIICATGSGDLYDYCFENLCFDAFGGRWIGSVGEVLRPDNPDGFGPLPNTRISRSVDIYNRLAAAWNLLTRARINVTMLLEARSTGYGDSGTMGADWGTPCSGAWLKFNATGPSATTVVSPTTDWYTIDPALDSVFSNVFSFPDGTCSGGLNVINTTRIVQEYRVSPDAAWMDAIPEGLQDLVVSGSFGVMCRRVDVRVTAGATAISTEETSGSCPGASFWSGSSGYRVEDIEETEETCVMVTSGTLDVGQPIAGVYGYHSTGECEIGSSHYLSLVPFTDQVGFVEIPLVDPV